MATQKPPEYEFINPDEYSQYIDTLPPNTQLRYIAYTSKDGNRAAIYLAMKDVYSLVIPYYRSMSHLSKGISSNAKHQTIRQIAKEGFEKETYFLLRRMRLLGSEMPVKNSNPDAEVPHIKHIVVAEDFIYNEEKVIDEHGEHAPKKTGEPVWMHNSLLSFIFEKETLVGEFKRKHPQREIFYRHRNLLYSSTKLSFFGKLKKMVASV